MSAREQTAPWRLPAEVAFPVLAFVLFGFFFAASAPSPIFLVLQHAWHFTPVMLTVAFGVYVVALLASLLVAGSLSDHVGRRPVLVGALLLQSLAMGMFVIADGIGGLLMARVVQGIATGIATGAMTAAVVESAPASKKKLGATISSVSPLAGLAAGALLTGIAIKLSVIPTTLVFSTLAVFFAVAAIAVFHIRELVAPRPGLLASLVPRVSIPAKARPDFMRAIPAFVTTWALGGLYLGLSPSIVLHLFGIDNGIVNGSVIALLCGVGAVAPTLLKRLVPIKAAEAGLLCIAVAMVLLLASVASQSIALFFFATALAGVGFGGSFSALMQILAPQAQPHERAELFAAIFVACYLAFSVPAMVAGLMVMQVGLQSTAEGYAMLLLVLALAGATVMRRPRP